LLSENSIKIIWILVSFFIIVTIISLLFIIVKGIYIELLYVSIFIGIMVLKEMIDEHIPDHLKKKVNIIISVLIYVWLLIVVNEIVRIIR